ncbi:MAG TPA: PIG-L deacetylase family protein [Thermomicrobiales bacterium]|nr:PIG-L deacetylase family protein [Thermomicrobiales bacterium]
MRLLAIGAHPDDCEFKVGGLTALWTGLGREARFLCTTNGSSGHHEIGGQHLVARRREEARNGAAKVGADSVVLDNEDGALVPTLENRQRLIAEIREYKPDVILAPRTNDYHPDHRYTAILVQDACYMMMVPNVVPSVPVLEKNPVVLLISDRFTTPNPFVPDITIDIDSVIEKKVDAGMQHISQVYEWLPHVGGYAHEVPAGQEEQDRYFRTQQENRSSAEADRFRDKLIERYGEEQGSAVKYAEAYAVSEYAGTLTDSLAKELFPF